MTGIFERYSNYTIMCIFHNFDITLMKMYKGTITQNNIESRSDYDYLKTVIAETE